MRDSSQRNARLCFIQMDISARLEKYHEVGKALLIPNERGRLLFSDVEKVTRYL